MMSPAGALIRQAAEIDAAIQGGFTVTLADVSPEEFKTLRMIWSERAKFEREKQSPHG